MDGTIGVNYWWPPPPRRPPPPSSSLKIKADCYYQLRSCFGTCLPQMIELMASEAIEENLMSFPELFSPPTTAPSDNADQSTFEMFTTIVEAPHSFHSSHKEALACFFFKLSNQNLVRHLLYVSEHHPNLIAAMFSDSSNLSPLASFILTTKLEELEEGHDEGCDHTNHAMGRIDMSNFYSSFYAASGMEDPERAYLMLLEGRKRCMAEAGQRLIRQVLSLTNSDH